MHGHDKEAADNIDKLRKEQADRKSNALLKYSELLAVHGVEAAERFRNSYNNSALKRNQI